MIKGSCVCGAVEFAITPPFLAFQYCHCSRCRKKTGSAHAANAFVPPEQFEWRRGAELVHKYELPNTRAWSSAFCTQCGSAMPWLARTGTRVIVPVGALDEDPGVRPTRNIHFASRAPWYVHASEIELLDEV